ncbi:hypothetical protein [Streptosporangium sp. NPDC002721]|uniref:hypothetical protein n=1 Tax=Streptosporangium sp. NPDC002721 TaxID=3366188 RepID=UPI00368EDA70
MDDITLHGLALIGAITVAAGVVTVIAAGTIYVALKVIDRSHAKRGLERPSPGRERPKDW